MCADPVSFTLTLVRHGESEANASGTIAGWLDVPLTERGKAELLQLRSTVRYPESDIYYSSSLKRAYDTCRILFPFSSPIISDDFREISFRSLEGRRFPSREDTDEFFRSWQNGQHIADEETMDEAMARIDKAIIRTVQSCEEKGFSSALIVMHSGIMRCALISLFGLERSAFMEMKVPNGLGYIVTFSGLRPVSFRPLRPEGCPVC